MNGKLEEHLQNIGDFIQIDDKIVTYKWISKALKVHTNTAKQLLYAYTKKPLNDQLLVTYIVAGEPQEGEGLVFRLVSARDLEETRKQFHKITSVHVYSIQKGAAVSGADIYNAENSFKLTADEQTYCSIQPGEEIKRRDIKVVPIPEPAPSTSNKNAPPTSKVLTKEKSNPKEPSPKKEEKIRGSSPKKASPKKNEVKKPVTAKSGGIGFLFKKQAEKKKAEVPAKKPPDEPIVVDDVEPAEKESNPNSQKLGSLPKNAVKTPASKSQSKKKRKKPKESEDSAAKRRKRIRAMTDSESSHGESDEERYPSPEPEMEAPATIESEEEEIIPATPVEKGRKRVRKQIDKTYTDEEGFIHTKKEYAFESCSDEETRESPKKKTPENPSKAETSEQKSAKVANETSTAPPKVPKAKADPAPKAKSGKASAKNKSNGTNQKQQSLLSFFSKK